MASISNQTLIATDPNKILIFKSTRKNNKDKSKIKSNINNNNYKKITD